MLGILCFPSCAPFSNFNVLNSNPKILLFVTKFNLRANILQVFAIQLT